MIDPTTGAVFAQAPRASAAQAARAIAAAKAAQPGWEALGDEAFAELDAAGRA